MWWSVGNPHCSGVWFSIKGKCPLWIQPLVWMIVEKPCPELTSLSCVESMIRPSINSKTSKNTKLVSVCIQRHQTLSCFEANWANPCSNMQRTLQVLNNFYLDHEVTLERPFQVWAIYAFTLVADFFLLFQPMSPFQHFFKPRASVVFKIGRCVPWLDVLKLIGITVFDDETVPHSFFDLLKRLCAQIFVHHFVNLLSLSSSTGPGNLAIRVSLKCCFRMSSPHVLTIIKDFLPSKPRMHIMHWMKGI